MSEERKIRFGGEELGEFSIRQVMRMAEKREIDHTAEYWSEKENNWRRLPGFITDFEPEPGAMERIRASGVKRTQVIGADQSDCAACKALQDRTYPVEDTPVLPPAACTCVPWCRCVVLAAK
jgi:hypothetical protein